MSFFSGYQFFVYLIILLIPAAVIGLQGKSLRMYRMILTALFIYVIYRDTPEQLAYLLVYAVGAVCLVKAYTLVRAKYGKDRRLYALAAALSVVPLVLSKWSGLYGGTLFSFLGISYIFFRVIQVIVEIYDGVITEISTAQFLMFLLFFPSLSSGPIDRSRRFVEDDERIWTCSEYAELLNDGIYKLVLGLFYKVVCYYMFYKLFN